MDFDQWVDKEDRFHYGGKDYEEDKERKDGDEFVFKCMALAFDYWI